MGEQVLLLVGGEEVCLWGCLAVDIRFAEVAGGALPLFVDKLKEQVLVGGKVWGEYERSPE